MTTSSGGRTFWDWVHGDHPTLELIAYSIITIVFAFVIVRYLGFVLLAVSSYANTNKPYDDTKQPLIIDHNCINISSVPLEYINGEIGRAHV